MVTSRVSTPLGIRLTVCRPCTALNTAFNSRNIGLSRSSGLTIEDETPEGRWVWSGSKVHEGLYAANSVSRGPLLATDTQRINS